MPGVLSWPTGIRPGSSRGYKPMSRQALYAGPTAGGDFLEELPGARWSAEYQFGPLEPDEWMTLDGLVGAMQAARNYLLLPVFEYDPPLGGPRGGGSGPMAATCSVGSYTVSVSGILGTNPAFMMGDRITMANRMHVVTATSNAAGGVATLQVWPRTRASLAGQPLDSTNALCLMRLASADEGGRNISPPLVADFPIKFIEVLP